MLKELRGTERQVKYAKDILKREKVWYKRMHLFLEETEKQLGERYERTGQEKALYYIDQLKDYATVINAIHIYISEEREASQVIYLGETLNNKHTEYNVTRSLIDKLTLKGELEDKELLLNITQVVENFSRNLRNKMEDER